MRIFFTELQKHKARAIWIAIIAVSVQPHQALARWHTNCFSPAKVKLLSAPLFPGASELSRVGHGVVRNLALPQASTESESWTVRVFVPAAEAPAGRKLYFEDPQTRCVGKIDLDRPLLDRRSVSYELVHEAATVCRENGMLSRVNRVEINPCRAKLCDRADNKLILFLGPVELEGVTIRDQPFYGGEFIIDLNHKAWRRTAALPVTVE